MKSKKNMKAAHEIMDKMQKTATASGILMTIRIIKSIYSDETKSDKEKLDAIIAFVDSSYEKFESGRKQAAEKAAVSK